MARREDVQPDLGHKIDRPESVLGATIDLAVARLEAKIAEENRKLARTTWLALATLEAVIILHRLF